MEFFNFGESLHRKQMLGLMDAKLSFIHEIFPKSEIGNQNFESEV
jgi:hypothetical protein